MNPKTIFKLHNPQHNVDEKHQKLTYIYMFFSFGYYENAPGKKKNRKYIPLKYSTGLMILPRYWEDRPVYRVKKQLFEKATLYNQRLEKLQRTIEKIYYEYADNGFLPTPGLLKTKLDETIKSELKKPVRTFNEYIDEFIKDTRNGKRLTQKNTRYNSLTIRSYKGFQAQLRNYQKAYCESPLSYEDITRDFLDQYISFFRKKGYSQNTISRHIKHLRMFMRLSREEGLHQNTEIDTPAFRVRQVEVEHIFLNEEEITRMYQLDLSKNREQELVRDVFLMGCYTAQRYADFRKFEKKQLIKLDHKKTAIEILQSKTGKRIILPLRYEAVAILKKYGYSLPYTYEKLINTKIKEVAKLAGIDEPVKTIRLVNGKKKTTEIPKYELVKTHTARRSGCTNMYLANIPVNEIMAISGHQTVYDFMKYIRASNFQIAEKLSSHPYFSQSIPTI